jgi:hypothetical protein
MLPADPNSEWLGHVQPVGLVVAPSVLARHGLVPQEQTRLDTEEVLPFLSEDENGPAVANPWGFFLRVLGWRPGQVAGAPGGPALPEDLSAWLPESETRLAPDWAVTAPDGGWQLLVQFAARGIDPDTRGALAGWEATPHQRMERLLRETGVRAPRIGIRSLSRRTAAPRRPRAACGERGGHGRCLADRQAPPRPGPPRGVVHLPQQLPPVPAEASGAAPWRG